MTSSRVFLLGAAAAGSVLFAACESATPADGDDDPRPLPIQTDAGASGGKRDAGPATPPRDAAADAAKNDDAGEPVEEDAGPDANVPVGDGGPTLVDPEPGTACTVVGETFTRACGACGSQIAFCNAARLVTGYGACRGAEGACEPGATQQGQACGACGTTTRTCNAQCVYEDGTCEGELAGGCVAGRTEQRTAECPTGQSIVYECTAACAWQPQAGATCTGTSTFPFLTIPATEGTTLDRPVTAAEQVQGQRNLFYECDGLSAQIVYGRFFELINPTAQAATVDVWNTVASSQWDFVMVAYDEPPLSPADLVPACTAVNDACTVAPYDATANVCFAGAGAVQIPANGRRWVYLGNFSSADPARAYTLHVKTVDLQ